MGIKSIKILDAINNPINAIDEAVSILKDGDIIAFPTETVYGLGASFFNLNAVEKVFQAKNRNYGNPLSAHISRLEHVELLCDKIPDKFYLLAEKFLPGPLSIVLRRKSTVFDLVTGGLDTLSIRMPKHDICLKLIDSLGQPLAGTSANITGRPSATKPEHVIDDFEGRITAVLDAGPCTYSIESTVLSLAEQYPTIIRPGAISQNDIQNVLGEKVYSANNQIMLFNPDNQKSHYKPTVPIKLFETKTEISEYIFKFSKKRFLILTENEYFEEVGNCNFRLIDNFTFFETLRFAEKEKFDEIIILFNDSLQQNEVLSHRIKNALK